VSSIDRFIRLPQSYKKLKRFKDIASILARHGFADVATRTRFGRVVRVTRKIVSLGFWKEKEAMPTGERIRTICEELGPTFIKFGQMLANRPDLVPPDVILELAKLQDRVPPFEFATVKEILVRELDRPVDEVFESIEQDALAAASIAQVHRARLRTGEQVVIKVKRPGLEQVIREDLAVLRDIAAYIQDNFEGVGHINPRSIVEEFARTFSQETDLSIEVCNMERYASNFEDEPLFRIPTPFRELCTPNLIVMEYLEGTKVTEVGDWEAFPIGPDEIAEIGTRHLLRSVFEFRFFHADPHPGNFMIAPDGTICLLDFGMMGFIDEARMEEMLAFMVALVSQDSQMLVETIMEAGLAPPRIDMRSFRRDVELMMNRFTTLTLEELDIESLIRTAVETISRHRIALPTDLLMVARALTTIEGIARRIYPEFEPLSSVQPYLISLFLKRALDPTYQSTLLVDSVLSWASLARRLPQDLTDVLKLLKAGELTIRIDDTYAMKVARQKARTTNRFTGALLAGAGVAGSIFLAGVESLPEWMSVVSFGASFLVALWVVAGIRKSGGM